MKDFYKKVYDMVEKIPAGKVMTYGQIAVRLNCPRNARVVGWAMRAAPQHRNLPCHRVINSKGEMAPSYAFGGSEIQRSLLEDEGVIFKENGRVDLSISLWHE